MRLRPWMAVAVLASLVLTAVLNVAIRTYLDFRAFANRIHEPLSGDGVPVYGTLAEHWADNGMGDRASADDGSPGLTNAKLANSATYGIASAYYGAVGSGFTNRWLFSAETANVAEADWQPFGAAEGQAGFLPERIGDLEEGSPFAILFIGVDRRAGDRGRADALLAVVLNPRKESSLVVSIPRDTRTTLAGLEKPVTDKINHAYAFGGVRSTVATVERFLGIPISRYIQADMEGFKAMVDIVGGVRVDNGRAFEYDGFFFREGTLELDGEAALAYVRMRKDDPRGDLGRADRQKAVLSSIAKSVIRPGQIDKWPELLAELSNHMKTDLTFEDWKALVKHYRKAAGKVETEQIEGSGLMLNGIYYFSVTEKERNRISQKLAEQLTP